MATALVVNKRRLLAHEAPTNFCTLNCFSHCIHTASHTASQTPCCLQGVLLHICQQLEQQQEPASRGLPLAATFAGLDALPPPQLFDAAAVGSRLSALVTQMHSR